MATGVQPVGSVPLGTRILYGLDCPHFVLTYWEHILHSSRGPARFRSKSGPPVGPKCPISVIGPPMPHLGPSGADASSAAWRPFAGKYQLTVRFSLLGSDRYGIPELFGREASFIDDRIDRAPTGRQPDGIARLVLEIDDVEQILHVGRGFAAGTAGTTLGETVVTLFTRRTPPLRVAAPSSAGASISSRTDCNSSSLFDRDRMRIFSSRRVFTGRPDLPRISRTAGQQPKTRKIAKKV